MPIIIGLVGEKLAGKDTVANFLVEKYAADHFRFTHILDEILSLLDLPISRKNEVNLGLGLRKIFGHGILGRALVTRVAKSKKDLIVVNGIRMDEMQDIKNLGAKIIYVTAPPELRYERYCHRHEKADDGLMNFQEFKIQEQGPTEVAIPNLGRAADFSIQNIGGLKDLYQATAEVVKELL